MALVVLAMVLGVLLLGTGTLSLSPAEVLDSLLGTGSNPAAERIVQRVRLPRVLTAVFVGASLGMAGAIFQSISRNALGSPDVIGFTTGAASGRLRSSCWVTPGRCGHRWPPCCRAWPRRRSCLRCPGVLPAATGWCWWA